MPLQKQNIDLIFQGGLAQKTSDVLIAPPALTTMKNCFQEETGELFKRKGFTPLGTDISGGGSISAGAQIMTLGNELLLADGSDLYSWDSATEEWIDKGSYIPMNASTKKVLASKSPTRYHMRFVYYGGYYYYTYRITDYGSVTDGYYRAVQDANTGVLLVQDELIPAASGTIAPEQPPFLFLLGTNLILVYVASFGTNIYAKVWDATDPSDTGSNLTLATDGEAAVGDLFMAAAAITSSTAVVAYTKGSTHEPKLVEFNSSGTTGNSIESSYASDNDPMAVSFDGTGNIYCGARNSSKEDVILHVFNSDLSSELYSDPVYTAIAGPDIQAMTMISGGSNSIKIFAEEYSESVFNPHLTDVLTGEWQSDGTETTAMAALYKGLGLGSQCLSYNGTIYMCLLFEFGTQNTLYLGDEDGNIVARLLVGVADQIHDTYVNDLPNLRTISTGVLESFQRELGPFIHSGGSDGYSQHGSLAKFDFTKKGNYITANGTLLMASGYLYQYDGYTVAENGFHYYPPTPSGVDAAAGGSMSDGTYSYRLVYEWVDNKGNIYRSAPSLPATVVVDGGGSSQKVTITAATYKFSGKNQVTISLYRTINGGQVYYNETGVDNDPTADTVTITSSQTDAELSTGDILYTEGGILDHIAPPATSRIISYKNRAIVIAGDNTLYYSKEIVSGEGIAFNDALYIDTDPKGGDIVDIATQDGQLIIGKEEEILRVYGEPANNAGQGSSLSIPFVIPSELGVKTNGKMHSVKDGILVDTDKGIWLLDHGLQTIYIGAPVYDYRSYDIDSIRNVIDSNQVRFLISDTSELLIWDTFHKSWGVWTNYSAVDSSVWKGTYVHLTSAGVVNQEDSTFTDNTTSITQTVETGYINPVGLFGYKRIYRILILGKFKSSHTMNIKITYDDGQTETLTKAITSDPTFYLYEFEPAIATCRSFRVTIWDTNQAGTKESYSINGIGLTVGIKKKYPTLSTKRF